MNHNKLTIVGLPTDENSSFMRGPALAPARIRQALFGGSANLTSERGVDLGTGERWVDGGDLKIDPGEQGQKQITAGIQHLLTQTDRVLSLGGDHAVTYPIMRAYAEKYPDLTILQLDAHPDLYDELDGRRTSHACPFSRIMENQLAGRLVQVGIRTLNAHQKAQAERFGVEIIPAWEWEQVLSLSFDGPLYISLDIDVFDPAYAPGVSHHEPGGLSPRDVFTILQTVEADIVGADIVELNPHRDPVGVTAMLAAKCVKELLARMI
ncbi:MAG: agmatinase [Ardenticatenaceae bacterium]|nr:agmatinase [Ardenticatenaceae bacterium]